jgi:hypothetical protein
MRRSTYIPAKNLAAEQANAVQLELAGIVCGPARPAPRRSLATVRNAIERRGAAAIELHAERRWLRGSEADLFYWSEGGEMLRATFTHLAPAAAQAIRAASLPADVVGIEMRKHALPRDLPRAERRYPGDNGTFYGPVWEPRRVTFPSEVSPSKAVIAISVDAGEGAELG